MRTISIGAQGFEDLIRNGYFYIDKTSFIREWWESGDVVTLITRPRRFGKTLNMSMLECFFSNRFAGRSDLFQHLSIWREDKYRQIQGTYPVIFLSFADVKERSYPEARRSVVRTLQAAIGRFRNLLDDEEKANDQDIFWNMTPDSSDADIARALQQLSAFLERRCHRKVLIFLDEYDTPLQEAYVNGYWQEMSDFIRSLFNSTFKTNTSLERAILTGITRVSKESIFSDLNNLEVVSTTSRQYETSFGFTQEEVDEALQEYGLADQSDRVRTWYDGFTFGDAANIYNPWSVLNFLKKREFAPYWANTSSNALISYELRIADNSIKSQMEGLMNGGTVDTRVDEQIIYSQLDQDSEAIWSLFLAGGYLRVERRSFDGRRYHYTLKLTNLEVELMFESLIQSWFDPVSDSYSAFTSALIQGNTEQLTYYLNDILLNVASSFDTRRKVLPGHEPESFYHGLVLGLVATERCYLVRSNRESGLGRYDVSMAPRNALNGDASGENTGLPVIIIEFKVFDPRREKELSDTAERALQQIRERRYDTAFLNEGYTQEQIIHYGMGFRGKEAVVSKG